MEQWRSNGVRPGWPIIPQAETVFIYRKDGTVHKVENLDNTLSGEDVLPGFGSGRKCCGNRFFATIIYR